MLRQLPVGRDRVPRIAGGHAAVGHEHRPGHERAGVREQELRDASELAGLAHAAQRDQVVHAPHHLVALRMRCEVRGRHTRRVVAGAERVDADPVGARSIAIARVMAMTPPLDALYATVSGSPHIPETEAVLTIAPPPAARRCGTANFAIRNMPLRLTPITRSQAASSQVSTVPFAPIPAFDITASSRPKLVTAESTRAAQSAARVTSQGRKRHSPPSPDTDSAPSSASTSPIDDARAGGDERLDARPAEPGGATRDQDHFLLRGRSCGDPGRARPLRGAIRAQVGHGGSSQATAGI